MSLIRCCSLGLPIWLVLFLPHSPWELCIPKAAFKTSALSPSTADLQHRSLGCLARLSDCLQNVCACVLHKFKPPERVLLLPASCLLPLSQTRSSFRCSCLSGPSFPRNIPVLLAASYSHPHPVSQAAGSTSQL